MQSVLVPTITGGVTAVLLLASLDGRGPFARYGVVLRCLLPLAVGVLLAFVLQLAVRVL